MNPSVSRTKAFRIAPVGLAFALAVLSAPRAAQAQRNWEAKVGAESPGMGKQALAFLPNELWIHVGDSITWTSGSNEIHTVTFLTVGQIFPAFTDGCPGFSSSGTAFDGSSCVTTEPFVRGGNFTVTFPKAGNYKINCLVHNTMNGVIHVLDRSAVLPHDQSFYDQEAAEQSSNLLKDMDHAMSVGMDMDMAGVGSRTAGNSISVRVLYPKSRSRGVMRHIATGNYPRGDIGNQVTAGVGEISSTPGGLQTASLVRFLKGTIEIHAGDTVEWSNSDPEEPHTITFGPEPADLFDPSPNVTMDEDGALRAVLMSPSDSVHSGFMELALQDEPGLPSNSLVANAIALNPTRFRVTFVNPGTYNYKCSLHDNLGMVGKVIVHP
jgi:plastocyanin